MTEAADGNGSIRTRPDRPYGSYDWHDLCDWYDLCGWCDLYGRSGRVREEKW